MKLGVCVPYRDREEHLHEFIPKVGKYLKSQGIDFCMYFAHQCNDKLFNRGKTKNIAASQAFRDGCTHIVWHDIDMIPEEGGGADYTYPEKYPRHIATQISQMDYQLKYHEYFGGAVVFSREQVMNTNGYSNDYWDWGMEDDDLFWRCHKEGYLNNSHLNKEPYKQKYLQFDGEYSYAKIEPTREMRAWNGRSHTISVLTRAYHIEDKTPIFLIGDKERKYAEYPILRVPGYDYGLSFNNSRALSLTYWNTFNQHNYMWVKRYDGQWSWITAVFDADKRQSHFYLNGTEVDSKGGYGSPSPYQWTGKLKMYPQQPIYLGTTPSLPDDSLIKYFKGDIAKVDIWNRALTPDEITTLHQDFPKEDHVFGLDMNNSTPDNVNLINCEVKEEDITIPNSILPHRVEGRFRCLPHEDEGLVNGGWKKGETTAKNEERYVLQMQQDKVDYKSDGMNSLEYELLSIEHLTPWAKMINVDF